MNFKECYEKVKNGTATDEEKAFVEEEIKKAKEIDNLLNEEESHNEEVIDNPEKKEVKKAWNAVRIKHIISTIIIVVVSIALIIGIGLGLLFGIASKNARTGSYLDITEAETMAMEYVTTNYNVEGVTPYMEKSERELGLRYPLTDSRYMYEVKIVNGDTRYKIKIDSKSHSIYVDNIDNMTEHNKH